MTTTSVSVDRSSETKIFTGMKKISRMFYKKMAPPRQSTLN